MQDPILRIFPSRFGGALSRKWSWAPFLARPMGDEGAGVVVGVVDTGFWPAHAWAPGMIVPELTQNNE